MCGCNSSSKNTAKMTPEELVAAAEQRAQERLDREFDSLVAATQNADANAQ